MKVNIYSPAEQATGAFDGGKITEQKPIGFPGEGSAVKRIGPLFYWAWAFSKENGFIPSHPHQGFEIMTYVVQGKAEHGDSLGTSSIVGPGGAQVMQTGSGVHHNERFIGPDMEGFQIWFEPHLQEAVKRTPTYNEYSHEQFPSRTENGVTVKAIIGEESPIQLTSDVRMWDLEMEGDAEYSHIIRAGYSLAALAIRGGGAVTDSQTKHPFDPKDFVIIHADEGDASVQLQASENPLRIIMIEVPTKVDYPLYRQYA
jgi:redox-sensitive bicupin YhaK (pirin superfamily)